MKVLARWIGPGVIWNLGVTSALLAILDLLGVAVIFPYLTVFTTTLTPQSNGLLGSLYLASGARSHQQFVLFLSLLLAGFFALKFVGGSVLYWIKFRANARIPVRLSDDLFRLLMRADYGFLASRSVSEMTGIINAQTIHATICLDALVTIATECLFLSLMLITVIAIDYRMAVLLVALVAILTPLLYFGILRRSGLLGQSQSDIHLRQYRFLFSVVSAMKDLKILGLERSAEQEHQFLNSRYAHAVTAFNLYQTLPRGVIELVVMIGLLSASMYALFASVDIKAAAPMIGFLAISALRVTPSYGRLVSAYTAYNYYQPAIKLICDLFADLEARQVVPRSQVLPFERQVEAQGMSFAHDDKTVLSDVSLVVRKGSSVGIVGLSGSGKTTFLDVLVGLRQAKGGRFFIDGQPFDPFLSDSLRKLLGYVPQSVTLVDDTIAFNISFDNDPDPDRLLRVARTARIEDFVQSLPEGFQTTVGENGVRVSGGQKQRIGIARALYRDPQILIFDEATSSLDNVTERELNDEIAALAGEKTLVIVAHRLSTVERCDVIHVFEEGRIVCSGTPAELLASCEAYRRLYRAQSEPEGTSGAGDPLALRAAM